jgi:5-formyltetrahydrofolate cyclo-ligase
MDQQAAPSKRALRAEIRERRRIMTQSERSTSGEGVLAMMKSVVDQYAASRIACYLSTQDEPPTRAFIDWALAQGFTVLLPVAREDGLMDWAPYDQGDEAVDATGMPIPTSDVLGPIALSQVDVIFIPAASIATDGMRLGWGRGYFDRTLGSMSKRPPVFAVVFDHEVVDDVPREKHDQGVDGIVTPTRIIRVGV